MKRIALLVLVGGIFLLAGLGIGHTAKHYWPTIKSFLVAQPTVYRTPDDGLAERFANLNVQTLDWRTLLPDHEQAVLEKYQQSAEADGDLSQQLMRSMQASFDDEYRSAMHSVNTVAKIDDIAADIAGFVVPLDFHEDKTPSLVFLVPYYGACIHFPPPPPNQIIFARLEEGFSSLDMMQAYRFSGIMRQGIFEDPLGTSAYEMQVVAISPFTGEPDDFRSH